MKTLRVVLTDGTVHTYAGSWSCVRDDMVNKGRLTVEADREDGGSVKRVYLLEAVMYWEVEGDPA